MTQTRFCWSAGPLVAWPSTFVASPDQIRRAVRLVLDVVPGRGAGFSLEAPEGVRFLIRSRLITDEGLALWGDVEPDSLG